MDLKVPNLKALGYGNIAPIKGVPPVSKPLAYVTKIKEASLERYNDWSLGNDGMYITKPFQTFTDTGFHRTHQRIRRKNW